MAKELGRVLGEATAALSRLDAGSLDALDIRASELRDSLAGGFVCVAGDRELQARFRVFADVVAGTGRDLAILRRARGTERRRESYMAAEGVRWVR